VVKLGAATIAFGLVYDLAEHSFGVSPTTGSPFGPGEHLAHLIVLVGMVILLVGVIADGIRTAGRLDRPEGSTRDAVR
jgi:hypothetical protein